MSFTRHRGDWPRLVTCDHCPTHAVAVTERDAETFERAHTNTDCRNNRNRTVYKENT